ncbi:tyrosine-type recombinase/integrase [Ensifer sp. OV372]|uniref:tyrosine-type recombinase/integrase n=1 Tax=Ensifer sp. OV372 TaxID=1855293 RepID=UPI0015A68FED|nr:tyrosine-type recombinase/integrase [Ensifer sp. OV372]
MADIDSPETRTRGRNDPRLARGNCRAIIRSATGLSNTKTPPGCSTGGAWTFISRSSLQQKIHLTDDVVRNLPFTALGGRRVHFADATVENMRLVVGGGRKAFYFVPDQPGNSGILRIGEYPETTTDRAREIAARLKSAVDTSDIGANSPDRLEQSGPTWTFAAVLEFYIQQLHLRSHNRSADKDAKFLRRYFLTPAVNPWALKPIGLVADTDVAGLINSLRDRPALARNCLSKVKTFFNWAMQPRNRSEFGLRENPALHLTSRMLRLRAAARYRHLSELEMRAYVVAAEGVENPSQRVFCQALVLTGQRAGDLAMMQWSELNLEKGIWVRPRDRYHVPFGAEENTPMSDAMVSLLRSLRCSAAASEDPAVFGSDFTSTGKLTRLRCVVDRRMSDYMQKAGLERPGESWRWMDVRRSVLTMLVEAGVSYQIARCAIGLVPDPYTAMTAVRPTRDALERLARALDDMRRSAGRYDDGGTGR